MAQIGLMREIAAAIDAEVVHAEAITQ
jgi:hypothetical protein